MLFCKSVRRKNGCLRENKTILPFSKMLYNFVEQSIIKSAMSSMRLYQLASESKQTFVSLYCEEPVKVGGFFQRCNPFMNMYLLCIVLHSRSFVKTECRRKCYKPT